MFPRKRVMPCGVAVVLGLCVPAWAQQSAPEEGPEASQAAPAPEEIAALVRQLDSDRFAERQAASDKLAGIGKPAIDALVEAATGESLEVTVRSVDILKKLAGSSDDATKEAGKAALAEVAKSDRPSAARRAQDALKSMEERQRPAGALVPGGIQIAVAGAGARRVSVRNVNGVKTIEAEERNRKVKIVDDPKAGIKVEVTTEKNGKKTTEKYEAKDAEELKKKHPEAHKIYKQYEKTAGGMVVQVQVAGGNAPIRVPRAAVPRPVAPNRLDLAKRMLQAWGSSIERFASDEAIKQASDESREELKKKITELKSKLSDLEQRLVKAMEEPDQKEEDSTGKEE